MCFIVEFDWQIVTYGCHSLGLYSNETFYIQFLLGATFIFDRNGIDLQLHELIEYRMNGIVEDAVDDTKDCQKSREVTLNLLCHRPGFACDVSDKLWRQRANQRKC